MKILLIAVLIWLIQVAICAIINAINTTRIPKSLWDLAKLTFLPYVITHLKKINYLSEAERN